MGAWRVLDLFPKIPTDLSQSTTLGGWFSTVTAVLMLLLFQVELFAFISAPIESQVVVDSASETQLQINFNMSFLDLSCEFLTVDALDILGSNRVNITGKDMKKWHLDAEGVRKAYHGRNREQKDILQFDESVTSNLEDLHKDGVHAVALNAKNMNGWLRENDVTLVVFHAPWCIWCQRLMPTIETLAETMELDDNAKGMGIATVNCVEEKELCSSSDIKAFPTLRVFVEDRLQKPDYSGDRTVVALSRHLFSQSSKIEMKHQRRGRQRVDEQGVHDDTWPGCMVSGHIKVNRVPGNFHIEAASNSHNFNGAMTNLSHIVHHMSFGDDPPRKVKVKLGRLSEDLRQNTPLDGNVYMAKEYHQAPHHYIKVVGTTYDLSYLKTPWNGYQAVANSQMMLYDYDEVPEARFAYNLSPMSVLVRSEKRPWYDFVTKVLAIIGGTFSVVGLVDAVIFRASRRIGRELK